MTAGLQVFNNDNILQIDGEYKNRCFIMKQNVVCNAATSNGSFNNYASAPRDYSGVVNPVVALRSSSPCLVHWISSTQYVIISNVNGAVCDVYFFGDTPTPSANYGLQVRNAKGELVFDSLQKYMRVIGYEVLPDTTHIGTFTYPLGKVYATIVSGGFWGRTITTGAPSSSPSYFQSEWQRPASSWSSNVLTMNGFSPYFAYLPASAGNIIYESRSQTHIVVVDVTGY